MPRSNWFDRTETWIALSVALNICAVLVAAFLIFLPYPNLGSSGEGSRSGYQEYATDCDKAEAAYRSFVGSTAAANVDDARRKYDAEKAKRASKFATACDLAAQHLAAEGARSAAHSGWYTMAAALFGVLLLIGTLLETMRVTRVTRQIGQDQSRAYVSPTDAKIFEGDHYISLFVSNSGQTPAKSFTVRHSISFLDARDIKTWSRDFSEVEVLTPQRWASLGADEETSVSILTHHDFAELQEMSMKKFFGVKGIVTYSTIYDDEEFETYFCFCTTGRMDLDDRSLRDTEHDLPFVLLARPSSAELPAFRKIEN